MESLNYFVASCLFDQLGNKTSVVTVVDVVSGTIAWSGLVQRGSVYGFGSAANADSFYGRVGRAVWRTGTSG